MMRFVGRVTISRTDIQTVASPTAISNIQHCFFAGVQFHLPKKERRLLESDYVELCPKTFCQCIQGFCSATPNYQLLANSICKDKEEFCCQSMKLNRIHRIYNHTLQQKVSASTDFIRFKSAFKYMKELPPETMVRRLAMQLSNQEYLTHVIIHIQQ
jgi:hypothetical protein